MSGRCWMRRSASLAFPAHAIRQRIAVCLVRRRRIVDAVVRLIKAGVVPERIRPGKPQQNGRHERMHLTLLQDTATPPGRQPAPADEAPARLPAALPMKKRPHQALATPRRDTTRHRRAASTASCVSRNMTPVESAAVRHNGEIRWRNDTHLRQPRRWSASQSLLRKTPRLDRRLRAHRARHDRLNDHHLRKPKHRSCDVWTTQGRCHKPQEQQQQT